MAKTIDYVELDMYNDVGDKIEYRDVPVITFDGDCFATLHDEMICRCEAKQCFSSNKMCNKVIARRVDEKKKLFEMERRGKEIIG